MNQDRNPYNPQYPSNDGFTPYPTQNQGGYPNQVGFMPYGTQSGNPFGQNETPFQPPPYPIRPDVPKNDEQAGAQWGNFSGLESKEIRRVFIRKVYLILMIQLSITFGLVALFHLTPSVREYVRSPSGTWLYWSSYVVFLVTYLILVCAKSVARRFPINMILLFIMTLAMGYMMGMISAYYKIDSVLIAIGMTAFICLGVTLFSFQTKFDFTSCMGVMFVVSLALMAFGFVCIFSFSTIMYKIYAALGAIVFAIFLAIDTQLIMGGKRHEISAEDHVFAAIMLYIDVVYIFIYILQLFGSRE